MRKIATLVSFAVWLFLVLTPRPLEGQCQAPTGLRTIPSLQGESWLLAISQLGALTGPTNPAFPATIGPGGGPYRGILLMFDLEASGSVLISGFATDLNDDGHSNWGPALGVSGGTGLVGHTAAVSVYVMPTVRPTSWAGTPSAPGPGLRPPGPGSPWQLAATGTLTVADWFTPSTIALANPLQVDEGTLAVAIEVGPVLAPVGGIPGIPWWPGPFPLHPTANIQSRVPGTELVSNDQFLTVSNGAISNNAFARVVPVPPFAHVLEIQYAPADTSVGYHSSYGRGCYEQPQAFYEEFIAPGSPGQFDLSNTAIQLFPTGSGYLVTPATSAVVPPTSAPVLTTNNSITSPLPLGFVLSYPGGSTSSIVVGSNGFVHLDPQQTQAASSPGMFSHGFLIGPPKLAPLYSDFAPASAGGVHFETGSQGEALITWNGIAETRYPTVTSTFQCAIFPTGVVEYRYGNCSLNFWAAIVGFNPGFGTHDPGPRDLSASMPFSTGDGAIPPVLTMIPRPILGIHATFAVNDIPAGASGFVMLGQNVQPEVSLASLGMPECWAGISPVASTFFAATGSSGYVAVGRIPPFASLIGFQAYAQAAVVSPSSNVFGMTVSNSLCIRLGF